MPILGLVSGEVLCFKWVQASDQMPCNEGARRRFEKEIRRKVSVNGESANEGARCRYRLKSWLRC